MIHPSAIVDSRAQLAADVQVGPFCVIGPQVEIASGCVLHERVSVQGHTRIGPNNVFHAGATIGGPPQDKKYAGEPTRLEIGARNTFRECVTVNCGTVQDVGVTRVGDDNWIMAYVHIAHDCQVGNQVTMANCTQLAGHVHVGDWVILGGFTGIHQFCKVGAHAMSGVGSVVLHDIPPFVMVSGNTASAHGLNSEGLRRRGYSVERIAALKAAYKLIYKDGLTLSAAREALAVQAALPGEAQADLGALSAFLSGVTRGIVR